MEGVPAISVTPETALLDEEQIISVRGLKKHQEITIHTRLSVGGGQYASSGCFRSDDNGVVDLSTDPSLKGTYTGVDTMGLFWSMKCEPGYECSRFKTRDVTVPLHYDIYIYDGTWSLDEIQHCQKACLATFKVQRLCKDRSVRLKEIEYGTIRGTLFIPKGNGPFPAMIYATVGTNLFRPALLSSHGFLVFQLDIERISLITNMWRDMNELQKMIQWLATHRLALPGGIAVYGLSFGGFVMNHLSILFKEIKAVVMVNSIPYTPIRPVYLEKLSRNPVVFEYDRDKAIESDEGTVLLNTFPKYEERFAKSWKSRANYLCIISEDDHCYDPYFMETWYSKWPSDEKHRVKVLRYPGAGHIVEPPFTPLTRVSYEGGISVLEMVEGPSISVEPETALVDEEQRISVRGLAKHQHISIYLRTTLESGSRFASLGSFRANEHGTVDLSKESSIRGTYTGLDSMGLFWSMKAEPGFEKRRFIKTDVTRPLVYKLYVYNEIYTSDSIQHCAKACVAYTEIQRWYMGKDVERIKIKEGITIGTLFKPKGRGPFPAVIDMFGGIGGIVEFRAALLASRGFLTLALPYLFYEGLPDSKKIFGDFTFFKENIKWLSSHPLAIPGGIGVIGVSFGGYMAHTLTLISKEVKAAVLINCPTYKPLRSIYIDTKFYKVQEILEKDPRRFVETPEGMNTTLAFSHYDERMAQSWETNANYLCILGADDLCVTPWYMENWYSTWPLNQRHRIKLLKYEDAGHLIEPPYTPVNTASYSKELSTYQLWGGKPKGHAVCQKDSWTQILIFLKDNLSHISETKSKM